MFGRIRKKREKKRKKKEQERLRQEQEQKQREEELKEAQDPVKIGEELQDVQEQIDRAQESDKPREEEKREQHKDEAYEDVTTDIPGLTDKQKLAMKESANNAINNQVQNYSRMLASQSGRSGVRGGAAAAPQVELAEKGLQAQNQFQRDLTEKDAEVALKKLAAYMASLEGKTAEDIIKRQQYFDYITGKQDKAKQDVWANYWWPKFSKV